jgi:hypothetical protein
MQIFMTGNGKFEFSNILMYEEKNGIFTKYQIYIWNFVP